MPPQSTKKIYLHGLFGSLVNLVVVSLYSLLVIRLSLDHLRKEEFGLLSLVSQVSTYLAVLDLGLFTAFSRILIDYATGTKERYANALKTASHVFHLLGLLCFIVSCLVAFAGSCFLSIPNALHQEFTILMLAQGITLFLSFSLKPLTAPLVANGKHYYVLWLGSGLTLVNAVVFLIAIRAGVGIYSFLFANTAALLINTYCLWKFTHPYRNAGAIRGRFDSSIFKEVTAFARDTMIWQIGGHTLASLPIILASVWFALGTTADLSGGMKLVLLMVAVCTRFGDMAVTPLSIEFAKGNELEAASKMTRIAHLAGAISACAALFIICVNPAFIRWWMLDKISWSWHENASAAFWIAIIAVTQCMYGYAVVSLRLSIIRWAQLFECLIYIALAFGFHYYAGSAALLWAKPVATLFITVVVAWQIGKHTHFKSKKILQIFLRQFLVLALLIPLCLRLGYLITTNTANPFLQLIYGGLLSFVAMLLAIPFLITRAMKTDCCRVALNIFRRWHRTSH